MATENRERCAIKNLRSKNMSVKEILNTLENIKFENTFNPYFDRCSIYDSEGAPKLRRYYLSEILKRAARSDLDAIWVGRDLGHRGGRRTGLALTDDVHFSDHLERWGLDTRRPTQGTPVAERTAAVIWDILSQVEAPVFLWNVFPLHPYMEGEPFSNRTHNAKERKAGVNLLMKIITYLKPRKVIAIGNDAYNVLSGALPDNLLYKVRHPSYGGQNEFLSSMKVIYQNEIRKRQCEFF